MLGDVHRGAAVLATERKSLQESQHDEQDRRRDADRRVRGQQAHERGRRAHDHDRDQEGVLAPDQVPEAPENERAERPHEKARCEGEQRKDETGRFIDAREELARDDRRERAVQVEVVPLEDGAEG